MKKIKVTLIHSLIGVRYYHRKTIHGLGLNRVKSSRILLDNPETRGMLKQVKYLIKVLEINEKDKIE